LVLVVGPLRCGGVASAPLGVWSRFVASMVSPGQVSVGVLVTAVPRDAVDEAVVACGVEPFCNRT
jgi:hypothetical protein